MGRPQRAALAAYACQIRITYLTTFFPSVPAMRCAVRLTAPTLIAASLVLLVGGAAGGGDVLHVAALRAVPRAGTRQGAVLSAAGDGLPGCGVVSPAGRDSRTLAGTPHRAGAGTVPLDDAGLDGRRRGGRGGVALDATSLRRERAG